MSHNRSEFFLRRYSIVAGLVVALVAMSVAYTRQAQAVNVQAAQPSTIAVVRLADLLEGLDERTVLEKRLDAMIAKRQTELTELADKIKGENADLNDVYKRGTPEYREKASEILELEATARVRRETLQTRISIEKGTMLVDLFDKINTAAEQLAKRQGFDAIFIDDSTLELPAQPTEQSALQLILNRRVLFASDKVDITAELRTLMNNNFNAGTP